MNADLITVVVPAYNNAPWLPRCLDSLLKQTHENLQIIVVNDGSTDDTQAVLDDYTARYDRIKAIHKENGGVTSARLAGVAAAEGQWIGFLDGDDYVEPQMFAHLLGNAEKYGADISHCGYQLNFPDGRTEYHYNTGMIRQQDKLTGLRDLVEERQVEPGLCNKLFRRELFDNLEQQMDCKIRNNEDMLMNYYLFSAAEKAVYEDVCPYHYCFREESASRRKLNAHQLYDPIAVRRQILKICPEPLRETAQDALLRTYLHKYAQLTLEKSTEYTADRKRIRELLMEQKGLFGVLSVRNRILANMICSAPWTFHMAYRVYVRLFQREEQH